MVKGIEKFREAFSVFSENYVIIGGTACDAVLSKTMVEPRATVDIDMILVVEKMTAEFANAFWQFVKEGQYRNGKRKRGEGKAPAYELYRFENGKPGFPAKIELLSRHSDLLGEPSGFHLEPIPTGEDVSSLSAIMMDEEYYELTVNNSYVEDGLRYASHYALVCLKTKAYLNLLAEREAGRMVNTKDIKKHRNDVLKLIAGADFSETLAVVPSVWDTIQSFVLRIEEELSANSKSLRDALGRTEEQIRVYVDILRNAFIKEEPR